MGEEQKQEKQNLAKDFLKQIQGLDLATEIAEKVKDNKIEFEVGDITYRVRKPNYKEQKEIEKFNRKVYQELLNDDTIEFRETIEKKLKKKGIDLVSKERKILEIQQEIDRLGIKALQAKKADNKETMNSLGNDIAQLQLEQWGLQNYIAEKLSYSLETRLLIERNSYITYLILEKKEKEQWKRAFDKFEDFMSCEGELINKAIQYADAVVYPVDFGKKEK